MIFPESLGEGSDKLPNQRYDENGKPKFKLLGKDGNPTNKKTKCETRKIPNSEKTWLEDVMDKQNNHNRQGKRPPSKKNLIIEIINRIFSGF